MKNLKKVVYSSMLVGALLLGGCGQEEKVVYSDIQMHQSGMSKEYFDELNSILTKHKEYVDSINASYNTKQVHEYNAKQHLLFLNSLKLSPKTEVDLEFDGYVFDFVYQSERFAEAMLVYAQSGSQLDYNDAIDEHEKLKFPHSMIVELVYKYDLASDHVAQK